MLLLDSRFAITPVSTTSGRPLAQRHILSNGVVALVQHNPGSPTVSVRGTIRAGACNEPAEHSGLALFTATTLIRGTQNRTFQEIITTTEERGCSVNAGGGMHFSGFAGKALSEDLPLVLDILADMLINPSFPEQEIEKVRRQFLMSLRESEQETYVQASRAVRALLYPPEHPYSRSMRGTMHSVQQISRDDIGAFHRLYHPAATTIAVVGDVGPETALELLERIFGQWNPDSLPPSQDMPPVPSLEGVKRRDIALNGKLQSDIIWAVHGLKRNDPDYYAAMVGNVILGHLGMGGRLGENVREKQGMAYSIGSNLDADVEAGPWLAAAGVNPANLERALQTIILEVEQFQKDGPTEQELSDAQAYLTGSLVLGMETNNGVANMLLNIERYNLGMDYVARFSDLINNVRHEDITQAVSKYLSTEHYVVATAGPPHDTQPAVQNEA